MAAKHLSVVLGDIHHDVAAGVVEDALLGFSGEILHVVGRGDLAEDGGSVEDFLVEVVVVFTGAGLVCGAAEVEFAGGDSEIVEVRRCEWLEVALATCWRGGGGGWCCSRARW